MLCVSHGVGSSTMSVVLHEVIKLVSYAECVDPLFIRIGTSGGLGIKPGTVVVANKGYNGLLLSEYEIVSIQVYIYITKILDLEIEIGRNSFRKSNLNNFF